eukprot:scaffold6286_cov106-Isochrysis_galbana.AAC.7
MMRSRPLLPQDTPGHPRRPRPRHEAPRRPCMPHAPLLRPPPQDPQASVMARSEKTRSAGAQLKFVVRSCPLETLFAYLPRKKRYTLAATRRNTLSPLPSGHSPSRFIQFMYNLRFDKGVWEGPHVRLDFVNNDDVCARFRDAELNPSSVKEEGLSCGGSYKPLVNDVMTDPLTDSILTKGRERSAPEMSHADTHTPLHGPTGGVPSDKALSDMFARLVGTRPLQPLSLVTRVLDTQGVREYDRAVGHPCPGVPLA